MNLALMSWTDVEEYLVKKDQLIIPIGSTEQHGPTGLIGTDYLTALGIAERVGEKKEMIVAPPICYGMSAHHMAFPGSASVSPSTLIAVVCDLVEGFAQHGFRRFYFINGHGGNIAPLTTAFCELKSQENKLELYLTNWWHNEAVNKYESEHFNNENGQHATVGEISVTMYTHPQAFTQRPKGHFVVQPVTTHWPLSAEEFRESFPDGRMGSNPARASSEHGKMIQEIAVNAICQIL